MPEIIAEFWHRRGCHYTLSHPDLLSRAHAQWPEATQSELGDL